MLRHPLLTALLFSALLLASCERASPAQTLVLNDTFQRPDTVAGPADSVTGVTPPPAPSGMSYTDISGNGWYLGGGQLREEAPGYPNFLALTGLPGILNQEVAIQNVATYPAANLRFGASLRRKDAGDYYYLYWSGAASASGFGITRRIGYGSHVPLSTTTSGSALPQAGHAYELRCSAVNAPDNLSDTLTVTLFDLTTHSVRGSATTVDATPSLLTATQLALANGATQAPTDLVISQLQVADLGPLKPAGPATGLTFAGPTSGPQAAASSLFTVAPFPAGASLNPGTVITPSDGGAGGFFTPATITLSGTAAGTFTYTPPSNGTASAITRRLTVTSTSRLANPPGLNYVALKILQSGSLTTLRVGDGMIELGTSQIPGQTLTSYQWYRSPSANVVLNDTTLLPNAHGAVLTDTGLTNGTVYFYVLKVSDNTGKTAQSPPYPAIPAKPLVVGFCGDSLTAGAGNSGDPSAPTSFARWVQVLTGNVYLPTIPDRPGPGSLNQGHGGATTGDWLPTNTTTESVAGNPTTNYFNRSVTAFQAAQASYVIVMLGTNDGPPASQYQANVQAIVDGYLAAGFRVVLNAPPYHPAAPSQGATLEQYSADLDSLVAGYAVSSPGQVFAGDRQIYAFYAGNKQYVDDGTHPTQTGADMFALFWAKAFVQNVLSAPPTSASLSR